MTTSAELLTGEAAQWSAIVSHPFIVATADGSLPEHAFDRWVVADHFFVVGFRRFLAGLVAVAPDEAAGDVLAAALEPLGAELVLFRRWAADRVLDLSLEPGPVTLGYTSYLLALLSEGWAAGVAALFGAERAYFDAWSTVRRSAPAASPYRQFIDNWSSDSFGAWVEDVTALLDRTVQRGDRSATQAFGRVLRFERRFWDAALAGDGW